MRSQSLRRRHTARVRGIAACALTGLCGVAPAQSDEPSAAAPALRFSGFGTLGLVQHNNDQAGAIFSYSQRSPAYSGVSANLDSVLGLQVDARLGESTSATMQGVARAGDNLHPRLRMGFVRQQFGDKLTARLGRIRSPLFLNSDVSEIGFAYLTARPALPVYSVAGNYQPHLDGADLEWRYGLGPAALLVQAFGGSTRITQVSYPLPREDIRVDFKGVRGLAMGVSLPLVSVRVARTWIDRYTQRSSQLDQLDAGLTQTGGALLGVASNPQLPPPLASSLATEGQAVLGFRDPFNGRPIYNSIGFDVNVQGWRIFGEWIDIKSGSELAGKYHGYHATVGYAIGDVTPYIGVARLKRKSPVLNTGAMTPTGLNAALDAGLAQLRAGLDRAAVLADLSTRSSSIGVRWDFSDRLAFKFQFDRFTTPSPNSPGVFAVSALPIRNKLNLLSVNIDFVF